jgi:GIY-YIG catalytic domain
MFDIISLKIYKQPQPTDLTDLEDFYIDLYDLASEIDQILSRSKKVDPIVEIYMELGGRGEIRRHIGFISDELKRQIERKSAEMRLTGFLVISFRREEGLDSIPSERRGAAGYLYYITHKPSGKIYVGSTMDYKKRFQRHKYLLKIGRHHCQKLQELWNVSKRNEFRFQVIKRVEEHQLRSVEYREMAAIDKDALLNTSLPRSHQ